MENTSHWRDWRVHVATAAMMLGFGLIACSSSGGSLGTCSTAPAPIIVTPVLQPRYVASTGSALPAKTIDANGDSVRIWNDTLYFSATDSTYIQATRVGRFVGFPAESITVERRTGQKYTWVANSYPITLPVVLGGKADGSVDGTTYLYLTVKRTGSTTATYWMYAAR